MRQAYPAIQAAGATVAVVGMGTPAQARTFHAELDLPFPVLSDPRRVLYRAYGVMRGGLRQLALDPRNALRGIDIIRKGGRGGAVVGDPAQLSGSFIIDPTGIVRLADYADLSSDFTAPATLLAALARRPGAPAASGADDPAQAA